jgi:hypothetical protein
VAGTGPSAAVKAMMISQSAKILCNHYAIGGSLVSNSYGALA